MAADFQAIVDGLAARVGRPVLIEDRRQRVVVYSEHDGPMDEVRRLSILRRQTSPEVIAWFRGLGILRARGPLRTPANPGLRMLPRVCVPIWHRDMLLGFLWFIDADQAMTDDEIALAGELASDVALALYWENLAGELASQRETEAVRNLVLADERARAYAARSLIEEGRFGQSVGVVALVAQPVMRPGDDPDEPLRAALEQALATTHRRLGPREALRLVRYDHGLLLVATREGPGRPSTVECAHQLNEILTGVTRGLRSVTGAVVGIGQPRPMLEGARASYDEALQAARVAMHLPGLSRVADWSQLGIYQVLAQLPAEQMGGTAVHPGLERLLANKANLPLLETLETYLDLAGNAHATSERLRLHRTSLYYRLHRVEQLAATNLKDGNERLCLHLGLKLARLSGRYRP